MTKNESKLLSLQWIAKTSAFCLLLSAFSVNAAMAVPASVGTVDEVMGVQQDKKVTGTVVDEAGIPVIGANVIQKGTTNGVITDLDGNFSLEIPNGAVIEISYIGYATQEITASGQTGLQVKLTEDTQKIDEVVVTALGIKRQSRSLGYSTTQVGGEDFTMARDPNLGNALSGKVAGVSVGGNPTGTGGSSRVIIRGNASLTGNNMPLYVVDGVPFSNQNLGSAGTWGGIDMGDGLSNINPDDIESIQVLKGAAASALYGYRGGNGAILITTKSGKKGKPVNIEFNNNLTFNMIYDYRDFQNVFGQGDYGVRPTSVAGAETTQTSSWGDVLGGTATNFLGNEVPYEYIDNWPNFYRTGINNSTSASLSGAGDKITYRFGVSNVAEKGQIPDSSNSQQGINMNTTYDILKNLHLIVNANYVFEKSKARSNLSDGNGNTTTTIVKDGAKGEKGDKGADGVMTWDIKSTGNKAEGSADTAKTIKHTNTVDMAAGKNLTVNQTNNSDGAKVEFALNSTVTNLDKVVVNGKDGVDGKDGVTITAPVEAKDGKDGSDGKVGISGKDGKDAVSISGKDGVGQIGLTGPKGKDGKDGASINITTDNGKQTLVNREVGADGKPGKTTQRIIYVPTDKDGNPLKDENGNTIKREVATMDDGLIFGGNTGEAHKAALGTQVNVKGATTNTDWNKFDAGKNIMTQVNGNTITVGLAKDLEVDNVDVNNNVTAKGTISAPTFKAGDTTINNGVVTNLTHHIDNPTTVVDDKVLNITDEKKKEAATVRDVLNSGWNLQANGKPVDAVTHGNNVNFASDKGTVTVKANSDGKTSVVNLDVNVDNDTITVNNKGQLVANGATNFNVATKDGGNKVAKKGGSSTAKITAGKTITYTAGKNIAIEQNGGEILVSTTNDVDHNSVTTNDLTVNKGGNIDMGGNQIHNVKAGTKDTDAVNVSQLKQSIGDVHKRINKVGKEARGGIAGANAAAGLPQVYIPGKSMVAASAGTFKGESAVAVGYSRSSDNGKVIFKLQGNANTQGDVGGSVGVGYQW